MIPAVDLLGDDMVRLEKGDYERVTLRRPAVEYVRALVDVDPPMIHVVDLDGARSGQIRRDAVAPVLEAAGSVPVQLSGGIRDLATATEAIEMGAERIVIGTAAFGDTEMLDSFVAEFGDRLVVALDVRNGQVAVSGWSKQSGFNLDEAISRCCDAGVARVLGSAIDRDGTLSGPDLGLASRLCASGLRVLAAGGIRDADDLGRLGALGCEGAIVGRAYAERTERIGFTA